MLLPMRTKVWMGLMLLVFLAHIPLYASTPHLVSLSGFFITAMVFANISFAVTGNINSLAATHFITWPAILFYGFQQHIVQGSVDLTNTAGQVLVAGYAIFLISLVLDFRVILQQFKATPA